jgi:hypothetical protein
MLCDELIIRVNQPAKTYHTRDRYSLNGKHTVAATIVVFLSDLNPLSASLIGDGVTITYPLHRIRIAVNGMHRRKVRGTQSAYKQSLRAKHNDRH